MHIGFSLLAAGLVITGVLGTVFPALPGAPLVLAGLWLAAWLEHYERVGLITLGFLAAMTVLTLVVDVAATVLGAKRVGASKLAVLGAALGTVFGIFLGPLGIIFGPFAGAFLGQLMGESGLKEASKVGFGTWLGLLVGTVLKLALVFAMLGLFVTAYFI